MELFRELHCRIPILNCSLFLDFLYPFYETYPLFTLDPPSPLSLSRFLFYYFVTLSSTFESTTFDSLKILTFIVST